MKRGFLYVRVGSDPEGTIVGVPFIKGELLTDTELGDLEMHLMLSPKVARELGRLLIETAEDLGKPWRVSRAGIRAARQVRRPTK